MSTEQEQTKKSERFSSLIKSYREDVLGMSTRELGEALDLEGSYIRQIETEKVKPSLKFLVAMRKMYGISLDMVVDNTDIGEL